jgi:Tfp pilus assembly protein PilV
MTMIEVLIAVLLVMGGVVALLSMQPQGWQLAGRSDRLGRAAETLHRELELNEVFIMNVCNANSSWGTALPTALNASISSTYTVRSSGMTAVQAGDLTFTVTRTITLISLSPQAWKITVAVTWPANTTGISESTLVTRQDGFRQGC